MLRRGRIGLLPLALILLGAIILTRLLILGTRLADSRTLSDAPGFVSIGLVDQGSSSYATKLLDNNGIPSRTDGSLGLDGISVPAYAVPKALHLLTLDPKLEESFNPW